MEIKYKVNTWYFRMRLTEGNIYFGIRCIILLPCVNFDAVTKCVT